MLFFLMIAELQMKHPDLFFEALISSKKIFQVFFRESFTCKHSSTSDLSGSVKVQQKDPDRGIFYTGPFLRPHRIQQGSIF